MRASPVITGLLVAAALAAPACHRPAAPREPAAAPAPVETRPAAPPPAALADDAPGPPPRRRVVTTSSITVFEPIQFVGATAAVDPRSHPMLDALAETFHDHADLALIEIRAYGPDAPPGSRQGLGVARALAIAAALVARGVSPARLRPVGVAAPSGSGASAAPELRILRR